MLINSTMRINYNHILEFWELAYMGNFFRYWG